MFQVTLHACSIRGDLTHWGRDKMDAIFQTPFSNGFFFYKNVWISIKISLKFVSKGLINNIAALVEIMVWSRPGDKPLSEPMMVSLPTHICVTRPQWAKTLLIIHQAMRVAASLSYCTTVLTLRKQSFIPWIDLIFIITIQFWISLKSNIYACLMCLKILPAI